MHWETLIDSTAFCLRRSGRFLLTELRVPHRVLSTSACNGGQSESLQFLVNHQSIEGSAHHERAACMAKLGPEKYHHSVCVELGLPPESVATMGTAANMNYATVIQRGDEEIFVTAVVTAGVQGNAACAGDPATWREPVEVAANAPAYAGTINIELLLSCPVTEGALARAVVTMTEAKTAALQQLAVRSRYSNEPATGTTTDQFCVAAPLQGDSPRRYTSTGTKLGEYVGAAVRDATLEALRWHNGLEASYTRGLFHALGRYGVKEDDFLPEIAPYLNPGELELLKKNRNAVMYEPLVCAAAFALASILDRHRYGAFPASAANEALRQQAASLAASLASRLDRWPEFHAALINVDVTRPKELILAAIALGWSKKWS
ncbi:MAG: adenosylcobinamide amidohydrolase [Candidatus Korobacteraceae bacterium]